MKKCINFSKFIIEIKIAALKYFKSKNFDGIIDKAVEAAVQRSKQLSKL